MHAEAYGTGVVKVSACLALVLFTGCGGSAMSTATEHEGAGGVSHGAGSSNDGRGIAGGHAGAGGKVPDAPSGGGEGPLACAGPDSGPSGGPRVDGPMDLGGCAAISDADVLARYQDFSGRVPQGMYYEPTESLTFWTEPCSSSAEETAARGTTDSASPLVDSYTSEWFYDAIYCFNGSVRRVERNLRCDYFDGSTLANAAPERLAFLASMLWWSSHSNLDGAALLGHSISGGDTVDVIELCSTSAVYGPSGPSDEVRLESTKHLLRVSNPGEPGEPQFTVELGKPEIIRTIKRADTSNP